MRYEYFGAPMAWVVHFFGIPLEKEGKKHVWLSSLCVLPILIIEDDQCLQLYYETKNHVYHLFQMFANYHNGSNEVDQSKGKVTISPQLEQDWLSAFPLWELLGKSIP